MPKTETLVVSFTAGPGHLKFSITIVDVGVVEYSMESDGVTYFKI